MTQLLAQQKNEQENPPEHRQKNVIEAQPYLPEEDRNSCGRQAMSATIMVRFGSSLSKPREVMLDTGCWTTIMKRDYLSKVAHGCAIRELKEPLTTETPQGFNKVHSYAVSLPLLCSFPDRVHPKILC